MGLDKLWQVVGFAKDLASVGKAFVKNHGDVEVAVLRATNHHHSHIDDKTMECVLRCVSINPESNSLLFDSISRRLEKTRDSIVALKTLYLIHYLLRGNKQLHITQAFGRLLMNCSFFFMKNQDPSSLFLRSYIAYLQERTGWIMNRSGRLRPIKPNSVKGFRREEEETTEPVFQILKCQDLIDKVLNCSPSEIGHRDHNLIQAAFCTILEESFQVYELYSDQMKELSDLLSDLPTSAMSLACEMLEKSAQQCRALGKFYKKCRGSAEGKTKILKYPSVEAMNMKPIGSLEQRRSLVSTQGLRFRFVPFSRWS